MNDLETRKELLVAQADLHRSLLALEAQRCTAQLREVGEFAGRNRWWLMAGAVAGGLLLARRGRGLLAWLPTVLSTWRAMRG